MPSVTQIVIGFAISFVILGIVIFIINMNKPKPKVPDDDLYKLAYEDCENNDEPGPPSFLAMDMENEYKQKWIDCRNKL